MNEIIGLNPNFYIFLFYFIFQNPTLHVASVLCFCSCSMLENLTANAFAQLYVTIFSTISLYLTKFCITQSFAITSSATWSEIRQTFLTVYTVYKRYSPPPSLYCSLLLKMRSVHTLYTSESKQFGYSWYIIIFAHFFVDFLDAKFSFSDTFRKFILRKYERQPFRGKVTSLTVSSPSV